MHEQRRPFAADVETLDTFCCSDSNSSKTHTSTARMLQLVPKQVIVRGALHAREWSSGVSYRTINVGVLLITSLHRSAAT